MAFWLFIYQHIVYLLFHSPPEMKEIPKIILIGVNICRVFQKKRFIFKQWYILTVLLFVYYLFKCSTHVWVSAILSFCGHHSFSLLKENHEIISGFGWHLVHILVVCCTRGCHLKKNEKSMYLHLFQVFCPCPRIKFLFKKHTVEHKLLAFNISQIIFINPLSANPTKRSNTFERIVWVSLTILWGWLLKG